MYIGRIITKAKNLETLDFIEVSDDTSKIDNTMPTLIIGRTIAESIYGKENIHVLDKQIEDNVYWTYSKLERRNDFERDLDAFNKKIINSLISNVRYEYISIFTTDNEKIKYLLSILKDKEEKIIYIFDQHLYMLYKGIVYGLSFIETEYIGVSREKIMSHIIKGKNVKLVKNTNFLSYNIKKITQDSKIIMPYLYFLRNK